MPLLVNLRHLEAHNLHLNGQLSAEELDIDTQDETIQLGGDLEYDLEVQLLAEGLLVQGEIGLALDCQCVRCLKPFRRQLSIRGWAGHLPLQGEEAVAVDNDLVDLTPLLREDILLEFPQHPLCQPDCRGLPETDLGKAQEQSHSGQPEAGSPIWSELNKLKFNKK